jgi:hypothetical protein
MRTRILLITSLAALGVSAPPASAGQGDIALKHQPEMVQVAKGQVELTFTTTAALPRRADGKVLASAKVGRATASVGKFVKAKGDPRKATKTSYIAHVSSRGQKLRVGTHVPVVISIDGHAPIKLKVTLARKYWK